MSASTATSTPRTLQQQQQQQHQQQEESASSAGGMRFRNSIYPETRLDHQKLSPTPLYMANMIDSELQEEVSRATAESHRKQIMRMMRDARVPKVNK